MTTSSVCLMVLLLCLSSLCVLSHALPCPPDQPQGVELEVMEANRRLMEAIRTRNFGAFR